MAYLDRETQIEIAKLMELSYKREEEGNLRESIKILIEAWNEIPEEPYYKYSFYEANLVLIHIISIAIEMKDKDLIKEYGEYMEHIDSQLDDPGIKEVILGKVNYELGNEKEALRYFNLANWKSKGECFYPSDKVYIDFLVTELDK